jgi:hypothetical protein
MSVDNAAIGPKQTTSYTIQNASNIVPPFGTPFFFGTSRFPNLAPCHPFFGSLRDLRVWNGVDCSRASLKPDGLNDSAETSAAHTLSSQ